MNIGQAAKHSGVSAKMIRYYESIGLIAPAERSVSNYRQYTDVDIRALRFIRRARDLGFSMEKIQRLLALWQRQDRTSAEVKTLAKAHIEELNRHIEDLMAMRDLLENLAAHCHGDEQPDCPILDELSGCTRCPSRETP